jgi:hypothetical protein
VTPQLKKAHGLGLDLGPTEEKPRHRGSEDRISMELESEVEVRE